MGTLGDEGHRSTLRRRTALCASTLICASLGQALAPAASHASTTQATAAAWTAEVDTLSVRRQALTATGTTRKPLVVEVPVPEVGTYLAELTFSGPARRRSVITVESRRYSVARSQKTLRVAVRVTDGGLTVQQRSASVAPVLTSLKTVLRPVAPAPSDRTVAPAPSPSPAGAARPSPAPTPSPARDHTLHPFAADSVWNLPIGTGASFEPVTGPRTTAVRTLGSPWANEGQYSHPVVRSTDADPLAAVTDTRDASRSATFRIPAAAPIAAGTDRHLHVISPDGRTVHENWDVTRVSPTRYSVGRHEAVDLHGSGIGPSNGTRAYGGSAIGGLIRAWEVDPTHPAYTGRIDHAIAIALRDDQLLHTTGASGYAAGYGTARGYVWPATEQDWDSPTAYSGPVPMGSYLAIPGDVDIAALGLTPQGLMLARAYQDYGAYVTDRSSEPILAYVEPSEAGRAFAAAVLGPSWSAADLRTIRAQLRVVTNNGPTTPNAAPLGGPRRAAVLR